VSAWRVFSAPGTGFVSAFSPTRRPTWASNDEAGDREGTITVFAVGLLLWLCACVVTKRTRGSALDLLEWAKPHRFIVFFGFFFVFAAHRNSRRSPSWTSNVRGDRQFTAGCPSNRIDFRFSIRFINGLLQLERRFASFSRD